jgi:uncharacterized protein YciI
MNRRAFVTALALIGCAVAYAARSGAQTQTPAQPPQPAQPSPAQATAAKSTFIVIYRPGPAWLAGKPVKEQPLKEHGAYILGLHERGMLKLGGGFSDDTGGAAVFEAESMEAAQAVVAADPAVVAKVMVPELHPWRLVDWQRVLENRQKKN